MSADGWAALGAAVFAVVIVASVALLVLELRGKLPA